jgi:glycosyltransferase involved in cell wall biosynthesis
VGTVTTYPDAFAQSGVVVPEAMMDEEDMKENFDVAVVISTYNRCDILPGALESVLAQDGGASYEVVVVDNNSTDRTREAVESFIALGHKNLRYVFEPRQGLSYGWNTGIAHSSAPIIAFTDDDVSVARDWVSSIKRAFDEHPEVDFVGGKVLPEWKSEPPRWLTTDHWSPLAILDHGDVPFYVNANKPFPLLNKSFRRKVFEQVGMFRPEMGRIKDNIGSTEDHDLQLRIYLGGGQGLYAPSIIMMAEVPPERLEKSYHRRWHSGHGRYCAMMNLLEITDEQGRLNEKLTSNVVLFGTPGFLYRTLLFESVHWLTSVLLRRESRTFQHENKLRHLVGYMRKRYEQHAATREHSMFVELSLFAKGLLGRKRMRLLNKTTMLVSAVLQSLIDKSVG